MVSCGIVVWAVSFELIQPPVQSRLTLAPLVDTIPPRGSLRVEVLYAPLAEDVLPRAADGADGGGELPGRPWTATRGLGP